MTTTIDAENAKNIRQAMDVVITITPSGGTAITITNDTLISCVVSLRSDLSIISPTLPESEINIEAYMSTDISDTLAAIPDGTPVTYQAGYDSDMSTVRNFYLAEQITWADNIMTIHAVDAVHLLDKELPAAMVLNFANPSKDSGTKLTSVYRFLCYVIGSTGINFTYSETLPDVKGTSATTYLAVERSNKRELVARFMNLFHQSYASDYFNGITNFWPAYVDAGIPTLKMDVPSAIYTIKEEDCADIQKQTERKITGVRLQKTPIQNVGRVNHAVGSPTWAKDEGIYLDYDTNFIERYVLLYERATNTFSTIYPVYEGTTETRGYWGDAKFGDGSFASLSRFLIGSEIEKGTIVGRPGTTADGLDLYTQLIPWDSDMADLWDARVTDSSAESVELLLRGVSYDRGDISTVLIGSTGNVVDMSEELFYGTVKTIGKTSSNTEYEAYPTKAFSSLLDRSNITGSFTWKGDPRMQPRDVVNFARLDGTTETITLENITITHQGGGTSAEITYRKGIC